MYEEALITHLSSFLTLRRMGQPREGREEPTLPEDRRKPWMGLVSGSSSYPIDKGQ